jgi:hypothetical protein
MGNVGSEAIWQLSIRLFSHMLQNTSIPNIMRWPLRKDTSVGGSPEIRAERATKSLVPQLMVEILQSFAVSKGPESFFSSRHMPWTSDAKAPSKAV